MHPCNSQLNETRLSQLLEVMKILQYIIQFSAACACSKQKESSSFLLWPRQTSDCMRYWSSCWGSQLCPTDVSNSTWETIWVIFPSNGFTSELQNRKKQKRTLSYHLQQSTGQNPSQNSVWGLLKFLLKMYFCCWILQKGGQAIMIGKRQKTQKSCKLYRVFYPEWCKHASIVVIRH